VTRRLWEPSNSSGRLGMRMAVVAVLAEPDFASAQQTAYASLAATLLLPDYTNKDISAR
jgi:hypothetical protein